MYNFVERNIYDIATDEYNNFPQKTIFTSKEWISFIAKDQNAIPIVIEIIKSNTTVGYFSGCIVYKYGVKILGSPFRGWSTCFMGIDLCHENECELTQIYKEITPYLKRRYRYVFMEIVERNLSLEQAKEITPNVVSARTLELDITKAEEDIFGGFRKDCRNFIRQFERRGARIEETEPTEEFAREYYKQLTDVFAKQGLVPTYDLRKVINLLNSVKRTNILCLRVIDPHDNQIASSIFFGFEKKFFFWGGASYRKYQMYRPNEYMIWYAIKYWKDRGCETFDMVGFREYKRKFGAEEIEYPRMLFAKNGALIIARNLAEKFFYIKVKIKGRFVKRPTMAEKYNEG